MVNYSRIFQHNRRWAKHMKEKNPGFFKRHFRAQNPDFLYIGCADSRISIEKLMGVDIGEVFVHRNIANIVSADDENALAVIQYAVEVLKVQHIVVSGHTGCGGIKASLSGEYGGAIDPWLKKIKKVYDKHEIQLTQIHEEQKMLDEYSRLNIIEQCRNLMQLDCVKKSIEENGYPMIHAWLYEMENGHLVDLGWNT